MSTVSNTIITDERQAIAAFEKLSREYEKLTDKVRKLKTESSQASQENAGGVRGLAGELAGMVSKIAAAIGAYKLLTAAAAESAKAVEARQALAQKADQQALGVLQTGNNIARAPEIERLLRQLPGRPEEASQFLTGLSGAAEVAPDRLEGLARAGAKALPLVPDDQVFGKLLGELAEGLREKSAKQVVNLAKALRDRAGTDAPQLSSNEFLRATGTLQRIGMPVEESLAFGVEAIRNELSPQVLEKLAAKTIEVIPQKTERELRRDLTADEKSMNAFAAMAPLERLNSLLTNPELAQSVLGERLFLQGRNIDQAEVARQAEALRQAQQDDLIGRQLATLGKTDAGRRELVGAEDARAATRRAQADPTSVLIRASEEALAEGLDRNNSGGWARLAINAAGLGGEVVGGLEGLFGKETEARLAPTAFRQSMADLLGSSDGELGFDPAGLRAEIGRRVGLEPSSDPAVREELAKQTRALEEIRDQWRERRRPPAAVGSPLAN